MATRKTDELQDGSANPIDKFVHENGFVGGTTAALNTFIFVNSTGAKDGAGNARYFKSSKTEDMYAEDTSSDDDNADSQLTVTPITVSVDKSFSGVRVLNKKDALTTLPNGQLALNERNMADINNKIVKRTAITILQGLHNNAITAGGVNQRILTKALADYTGTDGILEITEEIQTSLNILREKVSIEQDIETLENSQMVMLVTTGLASKLRLLKAMLPNPTADAVINGYTSIVSKAVFLNNTFKINGAGDTSNAGNPATTNMGDIQYIIAPIGDLGSIAYISERGPQTMIKDNPKKPTLRTNIHYDMNYGMGDIFDGLVIVGYSNGSTPPTTAVTFSNEALVKGSKVFTQKDFDAEVEKRIKKAQENIKGDKK